MVYNYGSLFSWTTVGHTSKANDDPDLKFSSMCWCLMMLDFGWAHRG